MRDKKDVPVQEWLLYIIKSGKCPGVVWHNDEDRTFRIPWTNQKSREWKSENFLIFKEYALKRGQYHAGDKDDFPKWKQNLKSALNKSKFIQRRPKQEPDPHTRTNRYRVYQFKKSIEQKKKVKRLSKKISSRRSTASNSSPTKVVYKTVAQSEQSGGESHAGLPLDLLELPKENLLLSISNFNYSEYLNSPPASIQTDENEQNQHPNIPTTVEDLVLPTSQKTAEIPASSSLPHDANTVEQQFLATIRPTNITDGSVVAENTSSSQALPALTNASSNNSSNIVPVMKTWGMQQTIAPELPIIPQDTFSQATNSSTPRLTAEESLRIIFGDAGGVETKATQSHGKSGKENISNVQNTYTNQSEPPRMSANHSHLYETTNAMPGNSSNLSQIMQIQSHMHTPMTQGCFSQVIQNMGNTPTQPAVTTYGMPNMLAPPGSTSTADFNNILQLPQAQQNYLASSTGPCYDVIPNPSHQQLDTNNITSATTHASVLNQICGEHSDISTSTQNVVASAGFFQPTGLWPQNAETCTILETSDSDTRSSTASLAEGISDIFSDYNMPSLPSASQMSISLDDQATLNPTEMSIAHPGEANIAGEATSGEDSLMIIEVFYGTPFRCMAHKKLTVPKARIYHGPKALASLQKKERNPGKIDYIDIPPANKSDLDKDKEKKVQNIVDEFETGVAVIYDEPSRNIYAERKCIPCVYLSDGVKRSDKVERTSRSRPDVAPVKAFDFEEFEESLKLFKQNPQDNPLPRDHFILTIGHVIKVNDDSPLRSVPVYIHVRHSEAFKLRYANTPSTPSQPMMSNPSDLSRSLEKMSLEENKSSLDRRVN